MHERLRWDPSTVAPAPSRVIIDAPRLVAVTAIVAALTGAALKWARPADPTDVREYVPLFTSDAALLIAIAIAGIPLVLLRSVSDSRTRSVQVASAVAGVLAVSQWLTAAVRLGVLLKPGRDPWVQTSEIGPVLLGAGAMTFGIVGVALSALAWRRNGVAADPAEVRVTRRAVLRSIVQVVIALAAAVLVIVILLNIHVPALFDAAGALLFIPVPVIAGGIGLWFGERVTRWLLPDPPVTSS
jgi:hypothetical protein